jgi:hypothetical protein
VEVVRIHRCRPDSYEDVVVPDRRLFDVFELKDIRRTIAVIHDRLHNDLIVFPRRGGRVGRGTLVDDAD